MICVHRNDMFCWTKTLYGLNWPSNQLVLFDIKIIFWESWFYELDWVGWVAYNDTTPFIQSSVRERWGGSEIMLLGLTLHELPISEICLHKLVTWQLLYSLQLLLKSTSNFSWLIVVIKFDCIVLCQHIYGLIYLVILGEKKNRGISAQAKNQSKVPVPRRKHSTEVWGGSDKSWHRG